MEIINDYSEKVNYLRNKGYRVNIEDYLRKGVWIFQQKPELFIIYAAVILVVFPIGGFLFTGPFTAGFIIAAHRINTGKSVLIDHFFDGFKLFTPLFLFALVSLLLISIGYAFFIIPGIYLNVAYTFAMLFIIFGKVDFWEGMELSRKLVGAEWFSVFGLVLVLAILNLVGALAFGVGLLFSIPISFCALYAAFDDIIGANQS